MITLEQLEKTPALCLSVIQNAPLYKAESEVFELAAKYYREGKW